MFLIFGSWICLVWPVAESHNQPWDCARDIISCGAQSGISIFRLDGIPARFNHQGLDGHEVRSAGCCSPMQGHRGPGKSAVPPSPPLRRTADSGAMGRHRTKTGFGTNPEKYGTGKALTHAYTHDTMPLSWRSDGTGAAKPPTSIRVRRARRAIYSWRIRS